MNESSSCPRLACEAYQSRNPENNRPINGWSEKRPLSRQQLAVLDCPNERTGIASIQTMLSLLEKLQTTVMKRGVDYDVILGTPKPTLLKPGAELIVRTFNMVPHTVITNRTERLEFEIPYFQYDAECMLCNKYQAYLGNGLGSCNSGEPSYAFKWVFQKELPEELKEKKDELQTSVLNGQISYRIESSRNDIFGAVNAIQKRAKKRAFVDAVLGITGVSRLFTQDLRGEEEVDPLTTDERGEEDEEQQSVAAKE